MKNAKLFVAILSVFVLLISCNKESLDQEVFEENWFRSFKNQVSDGQNEPLFESGETHITATFNGHGEFSYNRTGLGIYKGTTIGDTSAIVIESGSYVVENEKIDIVLNQRLWWDAFYRDMDSLEDGGVDPDKFKDVTFSFTG